MHKSIRVLVALSVVAAASVASAQQLVTNGGFEDNGGGGSSSFTGWTVVANSGTSVVADASTSHTGNYSAFDEAFYSSPATLSQTVTGLTVGKNYDWSFWLQDDGGDGGSRYFKASINGTTYLDLEGTTGSDWTQYKYTFTATSTSTTIAFEGGDDSTFNFGYHVDDVSLVPEPASLAVLGFGALGFLRRRKKA